MAHRVSSKAWAKNSLTSRLGCSTRLSRDRWEVVLAASYFCRFTLWGARLVRRSREGVWKSVLEMT